MATQSTSDKTRAKKIVAVECADDECDSHLCDPFRQTLETSIATAISEARAEEQRNFINNVAAVLDADDVELFTALIMKAKQSPDLNSETRSALRSESEIRTEVWKEAVLVAKDELWEDASAGHGPHRAQQNTVINCVIDALESRRDRCDRVYDQRWIQYRT